MSRKILLTVVMVLLVSLAVAGIAGAATPREVEFTGLVTAIDYTNETFELTHGGGVTEFSHHWATLYYYHPSCQVNGFNELMVGNTIGVAYFDLGGGLLATRGVVVFPGLCPQNN